MSDPDLLIPATPELLTDWCGPVWWSGRVALWDMPGGWVGLLPLLPLDSVNTPETLTYADLHEVRMPLARAEVRDRVVRCLLRAEGKPEAPLWRWHRALRGWLAGTGGPSECHLYGVGKPAPDRLVPSLADLNPSDDTRLPDGSHRVDAVALGRVWLEVCGGK